MSEAKSSEVKHLKSAAKTNSSKAKSSVVKNAKSAPSSDKEANTKTDANASTDSLCCHQKATPRSQDFQKDLQKRLNKAIGQLNGIKKMLDNNRYCGDVLIQLSAAQKAIHGISSMILQNHLETCVVEQVRAGNDEIISEVMALVKKFAR